MVSCLSSAASCDSSASLILRKSSGVFTRSRSGVFDGRSAMFIESPAHFDLNPPVKCTGNLQQSDSLQELVTLFVQRGDQRFGASRLQDCGEFGPPAGKLANGAVEVDVDDSPVVTCFARQVVEREDLSVR